MAMVILFPVTDQLEFGVLKKLKILVYQALNEKK